MAETTADFLLARLTDWGVRRLYGFPGDGINGLLGALDRAMDRFDYVQVRHEEEAAFMACAHAKFTGEPGVCLATSGPGAIHLLNGLYDAKADHQPVLAIVGQQARSALGGTYQQEVDLHTLFKDVAGAFVETCMTPAQVRHLVDRALRVAIARRTPTCLIVPSDVQDEPWKDPPKAHGTLHSGVGAAAMPATPPRPALEQAAEVLNAGEKVAILVGAGALGAGAQVAQAADLLGAGAAKALLGRAALPDDLPWVTGSIGLLGTRPSWEMMRDCDTLLMVGSGFPYAEFLPPEGQARGVQIDLDPGMLSLRHPMEANLCGDAAATLEALIPLLTRKPDRRWRETIAANVADWWREEEERAMIDADPINPERLFFELNPRLPDRAMITADSGTAANWFARALKLREGMSATLSGGLATMAPAISYAAAAKFAHPGRPAVAFIGDGAMQMLGLQSLITVARSWRDWEDPRLAVAVLNNGDLNQVTWELRAMGGFPRIEETQDVPPFDYAGYARMLGLGGIRVERPEDLGPAWDEALSADRPVLIDALVDPDVPSLPPHVTASQAKNFARALARGDPERSGVMRQSLKRLLT